jgi:hypothetical protein
MKLSIFLIVFAILLFSSVAFGQGSDQVCLTRDQFGQVKTALDELETIHHSEIRVDVEDNKITIISDWDGRVYVSGGSQKPVRMKLKIANYIERDMDIVINTTVFYRPKPPDPMFRLRYRAQVGVFLPQLVMAAQGKDYQWWDASIGFDFFHLGSFNLAVDAGAFSVGPSVGIDITKNFGMNVGYRILYSGLQSAEYSGLYFSFN